MSQPAPTFPTGPIDPLPIGCVPDATQAQMLRTALAEAGVELGAADERILNWLSRNEWAAVAVIGSWIGRAAATTPAL